MADTTTTNYGFTKPEVGASQDSWGTKLNGNWDDVDADLKDLEDTKAEKATTISAGTGLTGGGDLSANRTVTLADTAVTPGTYAPANVTVDQQGRITSASTATVNNANWSGEELAVTNGGTGAASAAAALLNFGLTATASELNLLDGITAILDQDNMASNSATALATQQSIKAYVDGKVSVTAGASLSVSSGSDFSITTGASGKALIVGFGNRYATYANFGTSTLQLRKANSSVASATGSTMEYDSRGSDTTIIIPYVFSGSANTTYSDFDLYWANSTNTQRFLGYFYIGF